MNASRPRQHTDHNEIELFRLRARWSKLPQWERELLLMFHLSNVMMPLMRQPIGLIDNSCLAEPEETHVWPSNDPWKSNHPFVDPSDVRIHPYVKKKYIGGSSAQSTPAACIESPKLLPVYSTVVVSREKFLAGGCFIRPYRTADDVIRDVDGRVSGHLNQWRPNLEVPHDSALASVMGRHISKRLKAELSSLTNNSQLDVSRVFATFNFSGDALLQALDSYRKFEKCQAMRRAELTTKKRSLRSWLRFSEDHLAPSAFEVMKKDCEQIIDSLDLIKPPSDEDVRHYRRNLGIFRKGTTPRKQRFWNQLIGWAVRQFRQAGFSNKDAFDAIALFAYSAWPRIFPTINPNVIKQRYYHSL